jgi:GT2 family glycosyltransferase/outer membrane murein-binding lipoprotein Lpp
MPPSLPRAFAKEPGDPAAWYDEDYYKHGLDLPYERSDHWLSFFGGIADRIVATLSPQRVFDAGCAWGFLVESLNDRGVETWGRDLSPFAISRVRPDMRNRCSVGSLAEPMHGPYDVIACIEVLEHILPEETEVVLDNLCGATSRILFSSTPTDFDEPTHVNVQPLAQWLRAFADRGFWPDLGYDASFVSPHAFLVARNQPSAPGALELLAETLQLRGERAAFLTRHNRVESLEQEAAEREVELALLEERLSERESTISRLRSSIQELEGAVSRLGQEAAEREVELALLEERLSERESTISRLRSSIQELEGAVSRLGFDTAAMQASALKATADAGQARMEAEHWMSVAREAGTLLEASSAAYSQLNRQLASICSSPGWQAVQRYRQALHSLRKRHSWFRKYVDPALTRVLNSARISDEPALFPDAAPTEPDPVEFERQEPVPASPPRVASVSLELPKAVPRSVTYDEWIVWNEPGEQQLDLQRDMASCLNYQPLLSIIVPLYHTPPAVLDAMIGSVRAQTYGNWELCIAAGEAEDAQNLNELRVLAAQDPRILVRALPRNTGISETSNAALEIASGEFVVLLDHDDTLAPFALYEVANALNQDPDLSFIYSDKDQIDAAGVKRSSPLFKPGWSPEMMWNANILTHLSVMRMRDVREVGGWRRETDGAQDWDLFLRVIQRGGKVHHIPKVLYHWRQIPSSVAGGGLDAKPYAVEGQIRSVTDHLLSMGVDVTISHARGEDLHLHWPPLPGEKSSILLIGVEGAEAVERAVAIAGLTEHHDFEILVCAGSATGDPDRIRAVQTRPGAGVRDQIQAMASSAAGRILVLLDAAATPGDSSWLTELSGPLRVPGVGMTGARIIEPDNPTLRHCGLVVTREGNVETPYSGLPYWVFDVFGGAGWYRNWSAVSGAALAIRRDLWDTVGGLSGQLLYPRLDLHLCLKLRQQAGLRILYNPWAVVTMRHDPVVSRLLAGDLAPARAGLRRIFPDGDPYFHPALGCRHGELFFQHKTEVERPPHDYASESRMLAEWFDAEPRAIETSRRVGRARVRRKLQSINWILPEFSNPFYGGVFTILRFANAFLQNGVESRFCFLGDVPPDRMSQLIGAGFPRLRDSEVHSFRAVGDVNDLPESDAAICTLWTTAYPLLQFKKTYRKFYFMQDDESLFYPAGSTSALVEATYRFGFRALCNTVSLLRRYEASGGQGEYFSPSVDREVFHARTRRNPRPDSPFNLFCYARPHHPRNCFELLGESLRMLKREMKERVRIITAGETWNPASFGLDGVVENLGLLDYRATGALYRACDAGTALMMTRHPSYLPLELMACGALVITNRNPDTAWLLRDGENCLLAEPTPSCLAQRLEQGLRDRDSAAAISARALAGIDREFSDWNVAVARILAYIAREFA